MTTASDRATALAMGLAVGVNSLAVLAMPEVVQTQIAAPDSAAWRDAVAATLEELERSCASFASRTSVSNLASIRRALSDLATMVKSQTSTATEISTAAQSSLQSLKELLGMGQ